MNDIELANILLAYWTDDYPCTPVDIPGYGGVNRVPWPSLRAVFEWMSGFDVVDVYCQTLADGTPVVILRTLDFENDD